MNGSGLLDEFSDVLITKGTEITADLIMNDMSFSQSYRPTRTGGEEQPEDEPELSRLMRE
jgi:hypothetical protein